MIIGFIIGCFIRVIPTIGLDPKTVLKFRINCIATYKSNKGIGTLTTHHECLQERIFPGGQKHPSEHIKAAHKGLSPVLPHVLGQVLPHGS